MNSASQYTLSWFGLRESYKSKKSTVIYIIGIRDPLGTRFISGVSFARKQGESCYRRYNRKLNFPFSRKRPIDSFNREFYSIDLRPLILLAVPLRFDSVNFPVFDELQDRQKGRSVFGSCMPVFIEFSVTPICDSSQASKRFRRNADIFDIFHERVFVGFDLLEGVVVYW